MKFERCQWDWSLKPLNICMKFAGINLISPLSRKTSATASFLIPTLLSGMIFLSNAIINSPRLLYLARLDFMRNNRDCEVSPWLCTRSHPEYLLMFTYQIAGVVLNLILPLIHIVFFVVTLILSNWRDLWFSMKKLQREIKLNETFHKTCRKKCLFATLLLLLVCI